eukprot:scaffold8288_cov229-Pinguiococcus_pyrenoidosus.AAC.2
MRPLCLLCLFGLARGVAYLEELCGGLKFAMHPFPPFPSVVQMPQKIPTIEIPSEEMRGLTMPPWTDAPCLSMYPYPRLCMNLYENFGQGRLRWKLGRSRLEVWRTGQFNAAVEVVGYIYQNCLVQNLDNADAFLLPIPFELLFRVLAVARRENHFINVREETDRYIDLLEEQLGESPYWQEHQGANFLLPYTRTAPHAMMDRVDGAFWNRTRFLSIEWHSENIFAMPYPTMLHPSSDADIDEWFHHVFEERQAQRRPEALLMVGASGTHAFRLPLVQACENSASCHHMTFDKGAVDYPEIGLAYLNFTFSIQPAGDTPTRRALFDSWLTGCIPILFDEGALGAKFPVQEANRPDPAYSRLFTGGNSSWIEDYALIALDEEDAVSLPARISPERVRKIQENIRRLIPRFLYWEARVPFRLNRSRWEKYGELNAVGMMLRDFAQEIRNASEPEAT